MAKKLVKIEIANSFVGSWNTTWTGTGTGTGGALPLVIAGDGTGRYSTGALRGTFDGANLSYTGTWGDSSGSGSFLFVLVGTDTFIGVWVASDGSSSGQWNGTIAKR